MSKFKKTNMVLTEERYNSLKSNPKSIIIGKFGVYELKFREIKKKYFMSIDSNPETNQQIALFNDLPDIQSRQISESEIIDTVADVENDAIILIDKGNYNNSYTYKLKVNIKSSVIACINIYEKPFIGYEKIKDLDVSTFELKLN